MFSLSLSVRDSGPQVMVPTLRNHVIFISVLKLNLMRNLLPLCRSPDTHVHLLIVKVNMNEAVVSLGQADKVVIVAAGHGGVGECVLGQLFLWRCTVAPKGWYMVAGKIYQD